MRYELILWYMWFLKRVPGKIGCVLRRLALPSQLGRGVMLWDGVQIDYPKNLKIGDRSSINRGSILHCGGGVDIGRDVLIGPNVVIYSQNHVFRHAATPIADQGYERKRVRVEDDVWLASNVIILPGVTVAVGTVVGAGSVVTGSTEAYGIYVGVPARRIGFREPVGSPESSPGG